MAQQGRAPDRTAARQSGMWPFMSLADVRPHPGATALDTRLIPKGGEGSAVIRARSAEVVKVMEGLWRR